jgi:hypothetical protein
MKTRLTNAKWFVTMAAAAGLAISAAVPAMAHGGGGMGGGMSHMGGSSFSHAPSSNMSQGLSSFKGSKLSSKTFATNQLRTTNIQSLKSTNLNTLKFTNQSPTTSATVKNTTKLGNINTSLPANSTLKNLGNKKVITPVNAKFPGSASTISQLNGKNLGSFNPGKVTLPASGFKTGPFLGGNVPTKGCYPHCNFGYPWFGLYGLGLWPYGYGNYGGYGYCGGTPYYGGTTVVTAPVTPTPLVSTATAPATTIAATPSPVAGVDLQLVDVRILDNGDASKQIGPRYRVSFRNAGTSVVDHAFNVALVAADDANLTTNLPTIEGRISSVATGEIANVDLRLPATAFDMGSDSHSEFAKLFVFVDSHGEVNDVNRDNNATGVDRTAVQPAT